MSDIEDQFYDDEYYEEIMHHRYIFTVRQKFNEKPRVDTFYELTVPAGLTGEQAKIMQKLDKRWCSEEIKKDTQALNGMSIRLRFNSDCYPNVCLVRTTSEITAEELEQILLNKFDEGSLIEFLEESKV